MELELIVLVSYIYLIPLSGIGLLYTYLNWILPRIKTRRGHIQITRILASGHLKNQWVKPVEETVLEEEPVLEEKEKDGEKVMVPVFERGRMKMTRRQETSYLIKIGKDEKLPYIDSPNFTYFQGPVKRAFYDSEGSQLSINDAAKLVSPTSAKMIDTFGQRMFNVGRMAAFTQKRNTDILILVTMFLSGISVLIGYYNYTLISEIAARLLGG